MKRVIPLFALALLSVACNNSKEKEIPNQSDDQMNNTENYLLSESTLPYGAPDFSKIKNDNFQPAMLEGISQQKKAIETIVNNEEEPTFENTVVALEKSGELLNRSSRVFYALTGAHTNETLQGIEEEMAPKFAAQNDEIYLNDKLFQRFKTLHEKRESLDLDAESLKLLEEYYEDFEIAGANLSDEDKTKLKEYNSRLATLTTKFGKTLLEANNTSAVTFTDKEELAGVDEDFLKSKENEDGKGWTIP